MKYFKLFVFLFLFWMALSGDYTIRQVLSGLVASAMTILIYRWLLKHAKMEYPKGITLWQLIQYVYAVGLEIILAGYDHLLRIPFGSGETEIMNIHLEAKTELVASLIANAITLTPGSVTIELNQKRLKVLLYKDVYKREQLNKTHCFAMRLQKIFK